MGLRQRQDRLISKMVLFSMATLSAACQGHATEDETGSDTSEGPVGTQVRGTCTVPEGATAPTDLLVAAVRIRFGQGPQIAETLAATDIGSEESWVLPLPDPDIEDELDALAAGESAGDPALSGALYLLVAAEDANGDRTWTEGEILRGAAMARWLAWIPDGTDWGLPSGWSVLDLGLSGAYKPGACMLDTTWPLGWRESEGYPVLHDFSEPIEIVLSGLETSLVFFAVPRNLPPGTWMAAGIPYPQYLEGEYQPAWEERVTEGVTLRVELKAAPPDSEDSSSDPDWRTTTHLALLQEDSDGDGAWNFDLPPEGTTTCYDGRVAWSRYTRPVATYRGYRLLDCYKATAGWREVTTDPETQQVLYLSSEQASALVLDGDACRLDGFLRPLRPL